MRKALFLSFVFVLLTGISFANPDPPTRIRARRPSQIGKKLALGPFLPVRLGLSGLGKGFNRGLVLVQEKRALENLRRVLEEWEQAGFVPTYGGMGDGAGFALGLHYTRPVASGKFRTTAQGSVSFYQNYEIAFTKDLGPVAFGPGIRFRHRPQEEFFGIGAESRKEHRTTFSFQDESAGWSTTASFGRVRLRHEIRWAHVEIAQGTDRRFPALQNVFDETQVVGRFASDDWLSNEMIAFVDLRDRAADPRAGAAIEASAAVHQGAGETKTDYTTYRLAVLAYIPLSPSREHVVALRSELAHTDSEGLIPFYAEPTLGGSGTLRGYREYRFRNRDSFLATAEYRYQVWRHADAVLFADFGQVYGNVFDELTARSLRSSTGVGFRFKSSKGVVLRINVGQSVEGTRLFFTFGPSW